jgi:hypothetical protein
MKRPLSAALSWLCVAMIALAASAAAAADWSVVQMSGKVVVEVAGARPVSLSSGETLPPGGVLRTGDNSRAMLVRDQDQMVVGPNTVVALPPGARDHQFTRIVQAAGVVEFDVEHRNAPHFSVTTPELAAVVKGTHFAVGVFGSGDVVKVARGRVEVTGLKSGQVVDVTAGQQATVRPGGAISITGQGPLAPILQGAPPLAPDGSPTTVINQASAATGGAGLDVPGVASLTASDGGIGLDVGGGVADVNAGSGGIDASVGDVVTVAAGSGGADVSVNGVADASAGSGGASVSVGDAVDADAGSGGVSVDVGGVHLGLGN